MSGAFLIFFGGRGRERGKSGQYPNRKALEKQFVIVVGAELSFRAG